MRTIFVLIAVASLSGCASHLEREQASLDNTCAEKGMTASSCLNFQNTFYELKAGPFGVPKMTNSSYSTGE
jgi:hypothetical protein